MFSPSGRLSTRLSKIIGILFVGVLSGSAVLGWLPGLNTTAVWSATPDLNGRILLQVEDQGQAWYVNPVNSRRYYLGRPADAFSVMRSLGLGVTNSDLSSFKVTAPRRLAGRILLQVQAQGQAYYVNPLDLKLYYLGRPADAFNLMRAQGLGITDKNLALIPVASASSSTASASSSGSASTAAASSTDTITALPATVTENYIFKYQDNNYDIFQPLATAWYQSYAAAPKTYTYYGDSEPANLREAFYGMFLQAKSGDTSLDDLLTQLKATAAKNNWTNDQLAEFTLALIQYIPYDHDKLAADDNRNTDPYYPYETLYLDKGVCSDKTFLAVALLRQLGYGAAILDFPDLNHSAVGIACPVADSINGSGYCYVETTNYFPLGVIPQSISSGQAQSDNQFANLFNPASLGKIEIYQQTTGRIYQGVAATKAQVAAFKATKDELNAEQTAIASSSAAIMAQANSLSALKIQLETYYANGQDAQYNNLVAPYNTLVNQYNAAIAAYQDKVSSYNQQANAFNAAVAAWYQK
jgi:hypothetical protein